MVKQCLSQLVVFGMIFEMKAMSSPGIELFGTANASLAMRLFYGLLLGSGSKHKIKYSKTMWSTCDGVWSWLKLSNLTKLVGLPDPPLLFRCDSTGDLYPVTQQPSSTITFALLSLSPTTWHRRLGHPSEECSRTEICMTDLGSLSYFLGVSAQRSKSGLFLSQSKFVEEILKRAHMQHCNPCKTPVDTESKLGSDGDPVSDAQNPDPLYIRSLGRSTSGYCVFLGDKLLSWSATRRQLDRNLLLELHTPLFTATLVYCDNVSAVYLSTNPVQHQRTKHIEIDIHFVREYVASGQLRVTSFED
ncbi:ribonuclease H-like domain-containing protein [Tanacetum coccineum]